MKVLVKVKLSSVLRVLLVHFQDKFILVYFVFSEQLQPLFSPITLFEHVFAAKTICCFFNITSILLATKTFHKSFVACFLCSLYNFESFVYITLNFC